MKIDCQACKLEGGMEKAIVPKFSGMLRFIGYVIAAPSLFGMFVSAYAGCMVVSDGTGAGVVGFGVSMLMFCASAVGGVIGWLLLVKKKVFRCTRCGFILDRS